MATPPKNPARPPELVMRYVLYSDEYGIYLGDRRWSIKQPENMILNDDHKPFGAPTVQDQKEASELVFKAVGQREGEGDFPIYRLVEVHPSLEGQRASPNDVANANLPRWE